MVIICKIMSPMILIKTFYDVVGNGLVQRTVTIYIVLILWNRLSSGVLLHSDIHLFTYYSY